MLFLMVQVIAEDGETLWRGLSRNDAELIICIPMGSVDDAEVFCCIIAIFPIEIDEDILALAGASNIWHSLLEMPSNGLAVSIHPQRVFAIDKHTVVWWWFRSVVLWWFVMNYATNESHRHDGQ